MVPESQLWTVQEPHRSRIERGLAWAAETPAAETNLDRVLKPGTSRARRKHASKNRKNKPTASIASNALERRTKDLECRQTRVFKVQKQTH